MKGRNHTEKSKQKMSISKRNISEETRNRMSISRVGKKIENSSSKYRGVSKRIANKGKNIYWKVGITFQKKYVNIGNYKNEIDAAKAYNNYILNHDIPYPLNNLDSFNKEIKL